MIITQIKQQINDSNRVSVYVDGKYACSLTLDQLLDEKLKKGQDIGEEHLLQLKQLSNEGKLRSRALEWILGRPHSEREFREYLYRKKTTTEHINALTEEFTRKGYLDERRYAEWFAHKSMRKNKSNRVIEQELKKQGISDVTIKSIATSVSTPITDEEERLKDLLNKLRNRSRYKDESRLVRYLLSKGFSYAQIKIALDK